VPFLGLNGRRSIYAVTICSDAIRLSIPHLLYSVRPFPEKDDLSVVQVNEGRCWLCGLDTAQGISCREVIRPSFTNLNFALAPESPYLCLACAYCLKEPAFRRTCFLVGDVFGFVPFKRTEGLNVLREPPSGLWACYVTHSYRKYYFLRTPINFLNPEDQPCTVQFEAHPVHIDRTFWELVSILKSVLPSGTKREFRTGEYRQETIERIGVADFLKAERVLSRCRNSRAFHLAMFLC